jgi:heavy metal sensor kinase
MARSIRARLQAWYALVLLAVTAGLGGILYYRARDGLFREIDAQLEGAAAYLNASLRGLPPHELDGLAPDDGARPPRPFGPPPPRPHRPPMPGPPPPRPREALLADLELKEQPGQRGELSFAIWRSDGALLKSVGIAEGPLPLDAVAAPLVLRWNGDVRQASQAGPHDTHILVRRSARRELEQLRAFAWQLVVSGLGVLAVGLAGGWLISRRIFRPVAAIATTASAISATHLEDRIDVRHIDEELTDLATVLNAMFDRLQAAFEQQTRFTADASHELRTPLAIIRSHAELALKRDRTSAEYREALSAILQASKRMTGLVDGLLTLARADAGKLDLQREPVDLAALVAEVVDLFRPLAAEKHITLTAELGPAMPLGDAGRLAQVATNLLNNAIQYNREGGAVCVHLEEQEDRVTLSVRDTGCGIPEEDRAHLFERFYCVDKARSRAAGGNGLGLAICKSIIEAHGGTIDFTTQVGVGTTFHVRLPGGTGTAG